MEITEFHICESIIIQNETSNVKIHFDRFLHPKATKAQ